MHSIFIYLVLPVLSPAFISFLLLCVRTFSHQFNCKRIGVTCNQQLALIQHLFCYILNWIGWLVGGLTDRVTDLYKRWIDWYRTLTAWRLVECSRCWMRLISSCMNRRSAGISRHSSPVNAATGRPLSRTYGMHAIGIMHQLELLCDRHSRRHYGHCLLVCLTVLSVSDHLVCLERQLALNRKQEMGWRPAYSTPQPLIFEAKGTK